MKVQLCMPDQVSSPPSKQDDCIRFDLLDGGIDSGDNMLQIANNITQAVAKGEMTIDGAEKFTDFLMHQRWQLDQAANKIRDEE